VSVAIEAQNLTKVFGHHRALRGVSLTLQRGEFLTIIGPNGAGKTTLLRCLAGLSKPSGGRVLLLGRELTEAPVEARRAIGFVSHETLLYDNLTAMENLLFYGRMYDVTDVRQRVEETLEWLGLAPRSDDPVHTLSRGTRQRLSIGRALLHRPSVVLLDEPHTGLDMQAQEMFDQTLKDLSHAGQTVLMTTHNLATAANVGSRLAILADGLIVHEATEGPLSPEALSAVYRDAVGGRR
jgi:heme exporter protein A